MTETRTYSLTRWIEIDRDQAFFFGGAATGLCIAGVMTALGAVSSASLSVAGLVGLAVVAGALYGGGES